MKNRIRHNLLHLVCIAIVATWIAVASNSQTFAQSQNYIVGDKVEVLWSGTWYAAEVLEAKGGQYKIHYSDWSSTFDEWVKIERIRRVAKFTLRREKPTETDDDAPPVKEPKKTGKTSASLKIGEYACTGSGGRMMIGLGFKITSASRYTDLDGKRRGTFSIAGGKITFRGGHLEGVTGRDLKDNWFVVGAQTSCGPFK